MGTGRYISFLQILAFLLVAGIPFQGSGQIWKRTEEDPKPLWRLKGITAYDFYPFPDLNSEKFYNSQWGLNYTAGVELTRSEVGDSSAWGSGLLYANRDFDQKIKPQDTLLIETPLKMTHKLRYVEVPVMYERQLVISPSAQLMVEGGLLLSFVDVAETKFTLRDGSTGEADINDSDFARFLFGFRGGVNFRKSVSDNIAIETGYHGRLFLTDIGKEQYANFTGIQIRLGLVYEFKNPKPGEAADEN